MSGAVVAVYTGHRRPVRCCLPHPLLRGRVFSGGDDCSLHLWEIDQQESTPPESGEGRGPLCTEDGYWPGVAEKVEQRCLRGLINDFVCDVVNDCWLWIFCPVRLLVLFSLVICVL